MRGVRGSPSVRVDARDISKRRPSASRAPRRRGHLRVIEDDECLVRVLAVLAVLDVLSPRGVVRRGSRPWFGSIGVRRRVRGRRADAVSIRLERLDDDRILPRGRVSRALAAEDEEEDALGGGGGAVADERRGTSRAGRVGVSAPGRRWRVGTRGGGEGARKTRARVGHGTVGDETVAVGFARARPCACVGVAEGRKRKDVKNV